MEEPTTIGLTEESHGILKRLKDEGHFAEMADAYRFAIALALSLGQEPPLVGGSRQTIFNVGTLDPDRALYYAVKILARPAEEPVYKHAERLAEWGVGELWRRAESGRIDFVTIMREAEEASRVAEAL